MRSRRASYSPIPLAKSSGSYGADGQQRLADGLHTKRLGRAEDIASAILFLASDAAWITGQTLRRRRRS